MKLTLTLFFAFIFSLLSFSQSTLESDTLNQRVKGKKEGYWIHKSFFGSRIKSEGVYKNGVKNGFWKEYLKNSPLVFEGKYRDGLRTGSWRLISTKNRTTIDIQQFHQGLKVGGSTPSF